MAYRDLTTGTKVDDHSDILIWESNLVHAYLDKDDEAYIYWDDGAGHYGDFTHEFAAKPTLVGGHNYGYGGAWAVGIDVDDLRNQDDCLQFAFYDGGGNPRPYLVHSSNASWLQSDYYAGNVPSGTWYYYTVTRSGGTLTCKIYSDADRTNLVDTLTISPGTTTYRYFYCICSYDYAQGDKAIYVDTKNFDLGEGGAAVIPPGLLTSGYLMGAP